MKKAVSPYQKIEWSGYYRCDVKPCCTCKNARPLAEFARNDRLASGLESACRRCAGERLKKWEAKRKADATNNHSSGISTYRIRLSRSSNPEALLATRRAAMKRFRAKKKAELGSEYKLWLKEQRVKYDEKKFGPGVTRESVQARDKYGRAATIGKSIWFKYRRRPPFSEIRKWLKQSRRYGMLFSQWEKSGFQYSLAPWIVLPKGSDGSSMVNARIRTKGSIIRDIALNRRKLLKAELSVNASISEGMGRVGNLEGLVKK